MRTNWVEPGTGSTVGEIASQLTRGEYRAQLDKKGTFILRYQEASAAIAELKEEFGDDYKTRLEVGFLSSWQEIDMERIAALPDWERRSAAERNMK